MMDARLQRLKLEGTPRVKRERRQPAPPMSPLPDTTDFTDFMIPSLTGQSNTSDIDFGSVAAKMMDTLFAANGMTGSGSGGFSVDSPDRVALKMERNDSDGGTMSPTSPSPQYGNMAPLTDHVVREGRLSPTKRSGSDWNLPSLPEEQTEESPENGHREMGGDDDEGGDDDDRYDDEEELMSEGEMDDGDRTVSMSDTPRLE